MINRNDITWNFVFGIGLSLAMIVIPLILFSMGIYQTIMLGTAIGAGIGFVTDMALIPVSKETVEPSSDSFNPLMPLYVLALVAIQFGTIPAGIIYTVVTGDMIGLIASVALTVRIVIGLVVDYLTGSLHVEEPDIDTGEWKYSVDDFE